VVYLVADGDRQKFLLFKLGKHNIGKSYLYFKKLADLDPSVLEQLVAGFGRRRSGGAMGSAAAPNPSLEPTRSARTLVAINAERATNAPRQDSSAFDDFPSRWIRLRWRAKRARGHAYEQAGKSDDALVLAHGEWPSARRVLPGQSNRDLWRTLG
jgi:hypothetical protein